MELSEREQKTAELYGQIHALEEAEHADLAASKILTAEHLGVPENFLQGKRGLDAGVGGKGRALRGLFRLGCRDITAVDISEVNIKNAKSVNQDIAQYVKFETKSILELDYPDESFDFIHCFGVIHSTKCPQRAVTQLYRCLSRGGWVYVGLYGKGGILYGTAGFFRYVAGFIPYRVAFFLTNHLLSGAASLEILDYLYVPYQFHYTEDEARELLSHAGFINIRRLKQPPPVSKSIWDTVLKPNTYDPNTALGRIMVGSSYIILTGQKPV